VVGGKGTEGRYCCSVALGLGLKMLVRLDCSSCLDRLVGWSRSAEWNRLVEWNRWSGPDAALQHELDRT